MAYSIIPQTTRNFSIYLPSRPPEVENDNYYGTWEITLLWLQNVADTMGEDFYAEEISFSTDVTLPTPASNDLTIPQGNKVAVLRKTGWGDLGILFFSRGSYADSFIGEVIKVSTGELYYVFPAFSAPGSSSSSDLRNVNCLVFNVSPSLKMFFGNTSSCLGSGIIFKDNLIITGYGVYPGYNGTNWNYIVYDAANKVSLDIMNGQYYNLSKSYMQLAPIIYEKNGQIIELNDVFTILTSMDELGNIYQIVRQDDILYAYHKKGNNRNIPIFCISNRNAEQEGGN